MVDSMVMMDEQMEWSRGIGFVMFEEGSIGVELPQNEHLFRCIKLRLSWQREREMQKKGSRVLRQQ
jgi:hypothetical protein